jgi:hypothetical protein
MDSNARERFNAKWRHVTGWLKMYERWRFENVKTNWRVRALPA